MRDVKFSSRKSFYMLQNANVSLKCNFIEKLHKKMHSNIILLKKYVNR